MTYNVFSGTLNPTQSLNLGEAGRQTFLKHYCVTTVCLDHIKEKTG